MKIRHIVLLTADIVSVILFLSAALIAAVSERALDDQYAAERWAGKKRYAQISVFTDYDDEMVLDGIFMTRANVEKKLTENSISTEKPGARIWADAFSGYQTSMVVYSDRSSAEAAVMVTGGDFFLFHPQDMISGHYYSENDTMYDRIVIDNVLAWQLFGSSDVVGMPVTINGKYFFVAGVYRPSENKDIEKVYGTKPRIFMPYQGYSLINEEGAKFSCYEACLPDPVSGLGMQIISESVSVQKENRLMVENSSRFGIINRFKLLADKDTRSVTDMPVVYPYWENAARMVEDRSSFMLALQLAGLIAPVFTVCYLFRIAVKAAKKKLKNLRGSAEELIEKLPEKVHS